VCVCVFPPTTVDVVSVDTWCTDNLRSNLTTLLDCSVHGLCEQGWDQGRIKAEEEITQTTADLLFSGFFGLHTLKKGRKIRHFARRGRMPLRRALVSPCICVLVLFLVHGGCSWSSCCLDSYMHENLHSVLLHIFLSLSKIYFNLFCCCCRDRKERLKVASEPPILLEHMNIKQNGKQTIEE
jgi:hypothetical protein